MNIVCTGVGCLLLGGLLILRNERLRRKSVAQAWQPTKTPSAAMTPVCGPPQFVCWVCCQAQPTPYGLTADTDHIVTCPECHIHSEIKTVSLDPGELYLGKMPVVNRVASHL